MMNMRANCVIEALNQANLNWKGRFDTILSVGAHDYKVSIIENDTSVEIQAWLPVVVDDFRLSRARTGIEVANDKLTCGEFHLNEKEGRISFKLYDLDAGTTFTTERMKGLLDYCRKTLETRAEPLCEELNKTVVGRFLSVLGIESKECREA